MRCVVCVYIEGGASDRAGILPLFFQTSAFFIEKVFTPFCFS